MANNEPPTPTLGSLEGHVRAILEQELAGFDGPCDITLRADGDAPDRSVFAVARLHGCSTVAIARVYEADLPHLRRGGVQLVYLSIEDAALLLRSLHGGGKTARANPADVHPLGLEPKCAHPGAPPEVRT